LGWKKDDVIDGIEFPCELKRRLPNNSQIQSAAADCCLQTFTRRAGLCRYTTTSQSIKNEKKISNQSLFDKKKKRNEKPLAVNDQQIMIVC
jgi:hypothetical protein